MERTRKYLRGVDINAPRVCVACNELKPAEAFRLKAKNRFRRCRPCEAAIEREQRKARLSMSREERERVFGKPEPEHFETFWRYVNKGGSCWLWTGPKTAKGYGALQVEIAGFTYYRAHRVSWAIHHGEPGELHVLHKCNNPWCVNPDHLRLGTNEENVEDRKRFGRQITGERNGRAKLTAEIVRRIRQDDRPQKEWAKELGVHHTTIGSIRNGKKWQHLN